MNPSVSIWGVQTEDFSRFSDSLASGARLAPIGQTRHQCRETRIVLGETRDHFDRPLRDLRVSVTDHCNFRCNYCMPADVFHDGYRFLPGGDLLTFDEIERIVRAAVRLGVTKVRLTGGEPLLRPNLTSLVERLSGIEGLTDLTLTTNGFLLADHATQLARAGLRRLTVSLDTVDPDLFAKCSGKNRSLARVLEGIEAAKAAGLPPAKINCVVQRGINDHGLLDLVQHFRHTGHVVRFIEYMDVGTLNNWDPSRVVTGGEVLAQLSTLAPLEAIAPSYAGEVARRYRFVDGSGEIGLINSVSEPFCGDCHRARLSADGRMLTCLFAVDGTSLRDRLRQGCDDDSLRDVLDATWRARTDRYSEQRGEASTTTRRRLEMYQIGG